MLAPCFLLLVLLLAPAAGVRFTGVENISLLEESVKDREECGKEVAVPSETATLQEYFDGLRVDIGLLDSNGFPSGGAGDPEKCTKRDICLLMRQLDMDFFERARAGTLTDADYDKPPDAHILHKGNCAKQGRGFRMQPIMDIDRCTAAARRVKGARGPAQEYKGRKLPEGCIVYNNKVYVNVAGDKDAKAGVKYRIGKRIATLQICEMDRSLEEAGAAYYSPYKLKQSMLGRESHSTSCSFGMYAFLAKLRLTDSHCAKILTYQTSAHFRSAQDALNLAVTLDRKGMTAQAAKVREYVETVRQKYVLMDTVANHWCPDIWTAAMDTEEGTCAVPRIMSWTVQGVELAEAEKRKEEERKKAEAEAAAAAEEAKRQNRGGRRHGGRLGHIMGQKATIWETTGNSDVLQDIDAIIAALADEDKRASGLIANKNPDKKSGKSDKKGKADKIALTEAACEAFDDETLAGVLLGKPEAPPDFFKDAFLDE
mmetsp:Transcript_65677/g.156979  ORF Transcript_65677/g.156979 Transcript_65677/m.156979 type:complete len:485 (-) Transcript_65677:117-1571(-)